MFQVVLALAIGIIIGWNFHLFYSALDPRVYTSAPTPLTRTFTASLSQNFSTEPNSSIEKHVFIEPVHREQNQTTVSPFYALLQQDRFSEAMELYLEGNEEQLKEYRLMLKVYFHDHAESEPIKTIERVQYYLEIEPHAQEMKLYLAELYRTNEEFDKALSLLFELHDMEEAYAQLIENDLNSTIETYMQQLRENKNFEKMLQVLEDLVTRDFSTERYMLRLAELYSELNSYSKAKRLLEELAYDNTYGAKAQTLLTTLESKVKEQQHYSHRVPLTKIGSQYSLQISVNNTPLTLLLDTGASYTFIDDEKIPSLQVERELLLNTAGGEIVAHLAKADTIRVQDLELSNFPVTLAPFKREHADGLLGMNFLSQFDFKIDQDKQILYLKKKF